MEIVLNTDRSYKLTELAKAVSLNDSDLIYIVQEINGKPTSIAVERGVFLAGLSGLTIENEGTTIGSQPNLNFIAGSNVTLTVNEDAGNNRIDVTIAASGGGGGGGQVNTVVGTTQQIDVDNSDPVNPELSLASEVTDALGQVGDNTSQIGTNTTNIGTNTTDIGTNTNDISNLQSSKLDSVVGGTNITVDNTDPNNPVINGAASGGQVDSVVGTTNEIDVDSSDPENPIVSLASEVTDSLDLADTALQSGNNVSELNNDTGFITESDATDTLRSFSKPQWLDVAALTAVSDVFTPDLGVSGSFTADIGANSTLANPTIPVGYDTGKVLAWDITFTITGAGGWTLAFGNQYFVDADVDIATIISDNSTTGDVIQLFFQFKNNKISVQPFIPTAIP